MQKNKKNAPVQPEIKEKRNEVEEKQESKEQEAEAQETECSKTDVEKEEQPKEKEQAAPDSQSIAESTPEPVNTSEPECELHEEQPQGSRTDQEEEDITESKEEQPESLEHSQEDRDMVTLQWHRYSDIPSFKDKPKQSGEYIVTEVTTKNEIKVSIRYYDVINDLWGYRSGATKEENHIYGQVKAWMEKPEPWESKS